MKQNNQLDKIEFGDFQTPQDLSKKITNLLKFMGENPTSIIEPTCGSGSFIKASIDDFPESHILGIDINPIYIDKLNQDLLKMDILDRVTLSVNDFFQINWVELLQKIKTPVLVIGNPPWVTSSEISAIGGSNLPNKSNIYGLSGMDAKTGKSNFDISEWMLINLLDALNGFDSSLAMLCKTAVARKAFIFLKNREIPTESSSIFQIDAKKHFGATVDACLFYCKLKPGLSNYICKIYSDLSLDTFIQEIGFYDKQLIANIPVFNKWKHLHGKSELIWRSGIKHDCSKVMELLLEDGILVNGYKEQVDLEEEYLYPMLKSSDLFNNRISNIKRFMIVTQEFIGEDTKKIKINAPKTWQYLEKHSEDLSKRASSIYKNRPKFSIFGVGDYSFTNWKIAISGFYKKIKFRLIEPFNKKPVVLDDTCYFLPIYNSEEALILFEIFKHPITIEFYRSMIFWDAKRPITKEILQKLNLSSLINEIDEDYLIKKVLSENKNLEKEEIIRIINKLSSKTLERFL